MLAMKKYYNDLLTGDAALVSALGGVTRIVSSHPGIVETFPLLIYTDDNQADFEYADNLPLGTAARAKVDIYTKDDATMPTSTTLGMHVARIFKAAFWNCSMNAEVPDDTLGVRHRVMRFNRELFPTEI